MRAFVAIQLPDEVRSALYHAAAPLRSLGLPVRWMDADALHLTLVFLGQVDDAHVPRIQVVLGDVAAGHPPMEFAIHGLGAFPRHGAVRIVWIGATATPALGALHEDLADRLEPLGFPREARPFTPHLTIGRARRDAGRIALPDVSFDFRATVRVRELALMRSHTGVARAHYERVSGAALGQPAAQEA